MSLFGDISHIEFANALRSAIASFGHVKPPEGFEALRMHELGIDQNGTTYTSRSGRGKAIVVQQDDELIVAFRGTDKFNDVKDYDNISFARNYYKQFESLLRHVADTVRQGDLHVTFTGASLGGAAVNVLADRADRLWGKAFKDADFVGISSPYLSGNRKVDLFNFGFGNDIVYHLVPGSWNNASRSMATKHVFLYENHQYFKDDNLRDRVSPHHVGNYADAIAALGELQLDDGKMLADKLNPHSFVLFDSAREIVQARRLEHPAGSPLAIIGQDRRDKMYGSTENDRGSHIEWFFGRGGDDKILGRAGNDLLYGNNGDDFLKGGAGADYISGGKGRDTICLEDSRDRTMGGADKDHFIVADILPKNDAGKLTPFGNHAPRIFIEDFEPGTDVLDIRRVDGHLNKKNDQPLHFAGYAQYDGSDGLDALEKGYVNDRSPGSVTIFTDKSGDTLVIVNCDTDRSRELEIVIHGDVGNIIDDLLF
ncbi:MAG: lipase [Rhizobium sp.]|nr:lipase [Rhizobium sp.]